MHWAIYISHHVLLHITIGGCLVLEIFDMCTWGFAAIALIGQILMPESPVYFVRRRKLSEARKALSRLAIL
jgi:hypothetical protein